MERGPFHAGAGARLLYYAERGPFHAGAGARLLYYAELDPFAGIGQTVADFRAAIIEVTTSCLLFDVVKVQPDNLLGHALTLPIFERLAPFVRAGRLTTSADVRAAPPHEYLHTRVAEAMARSARGRGRDHAQQRRELEERRRFAALMPARWIASRSVRAQVGMFAERMRRYRAGAPRGARVEARLLGWIERGLDAGVRVDRDFVFAHLARLRDSASPRDLARLGAVALPEDCAPCVEPLRPPEKGPGILKNRVELVRFGRARRPPCITTDPALSYPAATLSRARGRCEGSSHKRSPTLLGRAHCPRTRSVSHCST